MVLPPNCNPGSRPPNPGNEIRQAPSFRWAQLHLLMIRISLLHWSAKKTIATSSGIAVPPVESRNGFFEWVWFQRHLQNPVYAFGDGKHSILTPTLLRNADGSLLREKGMLRMWFSSTWFEGGNSVHALHEATSRNGIQWSKPSPALLKDVYAPSIIKSGQEYQMWNTDVGRNPWQIRHARSTDGRQWRVTPDPCLVVNQKWERTRLFYPTVLRKNGIYFMWYGSYWSERANTTALGFAVSLDGQRWSKHPQNPVLRPDPQRP